MKSYVQVYTGDGKGKTTAAMGLALRAAGSGLSVCIVQFAKGRPSGEIEALARFEDRIAVRRFGSDRFIRGKPTPEDAAQARAGLAAAREAMLSREYSIVILDEILVAAHFRLLAVEDVTALIDARPDDVELVLTGRNADPRIVERADLVTEMRAVKHYFDRGVQARPGIEE
ncbi:cob(I)yrinic acid a,c-diamide adenosyltransferase [Candidatus Sumerlaeota bacterium]|nr:cob(I)yrinic acid a,c-diamide adenosyltransferase [Candidatus Sumerlaeota bacterium]